MHHTTPLLLLLFLQASAASFGGAIVVDELDLQNRWNAWKSRHGRVYRDAGENARRLAVFKHNLLYVRGHNRRYHAGLESYITDLNQFADLTSEEFIRKYLSLPRAPPPRRRATLWRGSRPRQDLPEEVDWRTKNLVTEIKNQGNCGSCWAFSATGALEGALAKKTGKLVSLSEQQLVDCSGDTGNLGCNGGYMSNAFKYLEDHLIEPESAYPYRARDGTCKYNSSLGLAKVTDIGGIPKENETALMEASATVGPISIGIDASALGFMFYRHGIYKSHWCSKENINHGVLLIGYGKLKGSPYWLVKNSWGKLWGMKGYIMMAKDYNNMCGIASLADFPYV
ncbi:unnamed protein product [Mesocestoides corti]|uniref:Cathepsin L n=1 Tax=Mesocestoides corti TaxID=53468 RepID=A0A0R3UGZ4_MESCO|nr:unnamed protein product [Mesocestoides corti]